MLAVVRGEYVLPTAIIPDYPVALERVLKTALAVDKNQRYASCGKLLEAIQGLAEHEGWSLDTSSIVEIMHELYGAAPDPFAAMTTVEVSDSAIVDEVSGDYAIPMQPSPTVIITRPRRLAHGTDSDVSDDVPTRGRRSMPAMFAPRVAA